MRCVVRKKRLARGGVRNQASREFMRLTDESREVRISAGEHGVAAENLDQDIRFSGNIFENDCDDVARCDTHFAAEFAALVHQLKNNYENS